MSEALRQLAEDVAREAGDGLRTAFGRLSELQVSTKSSPSDWVSEADTQTEELIRARLDAARPDDAILGEEGDDKPGTTGLRWVVDPLDGTVNFLFGIPIWAVSVAVEDADGVLAGVVYDPMADELWSAARDGDPAMNGAPVRSPVRADLGTALVATGFGYDSAVRERQAAVVARLLPQVRDVRRLGSAALDLAWLAAGRYDAYYEFGINHWDVAAGALICERAGLAVHHFPADPPAGPGMVAGAAALVEALVPILTD